ncbi:MAG TPA: DedA family protein [Chloroflexota bacterium]
MHFTAASLQQILGTWGYVAVFIFVAIESTGIPFPGETMLITAAAYAGTGHLQIPFVIGAAAMGAVMGDNLGYLIGRTGGRSIVERYGHHVRLDADKLEVAENFFSRHGDKTVFFGRFVAVLRAWAAFLAGLNRMHWMKFYAFNAAGGIVWSLFFGILAFYLGKNLPLLEKIVRAIGIGGVALAVVVIAGIFVWHLKRQAHRREEAGHPDTSKSA